MIYVPSIKKFAHESILSDTTFRQQYWIWQKPDRINATPELLRVIQSSDT